MKNRLFACIILIAGDVGFAAAQSAGRVFNLKWDATTLIDVIAPAAAYSLEMQTRDRWSMELGFGLPIYFGNFSDREAYKFHRWRAEISRLAQRRGRFRFQWGLEWHFIPRNYTYLYGAFLDKQGQEFTFDYARVHDRTNMIIFNWGGIINFGERFVFEFFTGTGVRFAHLTYYDVLNPTPGGYPNYYDSYLFETDFRREGTHLRPHWTTGIKLGLRL